MSVDGMASKLELLYKDEDLRHRIAENGMNWVHNNLVWDKNIVPKWEALMDEAVKSLDEGDEDENRFRGAMEV